MASAVSLLALGIVTNVVAFAVLNAILFRPLPFANPGRLVAIHEVSPLDPGRRLSLSSDNFQTLTGQQRTLQQIAAYIPPSLTFGFDLAGEGMPERASGAIVSSNWFALLGVRPRVGRGFLPGEDKPGSTRVAVLGYRLWQRRFGGSRQVVGKQLEVNRRVYTVVGVMPPGFDFPDGAELWIPGPLHSASALNFTATPVHMWLNIVARLRPGVSLKQARAELSAVGAHMADPMAPGGHVTLTALRLREELSGDLRPALLLAFGATCFVLLAACANVANLMLARLMGRRKEIAVRLALGCPPARVIRQSIIEGEVVSTAAGAVGLLVTAWVFSLLRGTLAARVISLARLSLDVRVAGFTLAVCLLAGLLLGLGAVLPASVLDLNGGLRATRGESSATRDGTRLRALLIISEVASALVLMVGAGLLVKSFYKLTNQRLGFETRGVLGVTLALRGRSYATQEQQLAFYERLLDAVRVMPGVRHAALSSSFPVVGDRLNVQASRPPDGGRFGSEGVSADGVLVTPEYFRVMGISLLSGRDFSKSDKGLMPPVAIIDQTVSRLLWPGLKPTSQRLMVGGREYRVVGVAPNVRQLGYLTNVKPMVYLLYPQSAPFVTMSLLVRVKGRPEEAARGIREAVWTVDRDLPVPEIAPLAQIVSDSVDRQRVQAALITLFGLLALALAVTGVYAVVSSTVSRRTHEVGIRMALGASRSDVVWLAISQEARPALIGLGVGLALASALTRFLSSLLYRVRPLDPAILLCAATTLGLAALCAAYFPARRAAKVDPAVALRCE